MAAGAEAAHGAQTLAERADHEVNLIHDAGLLYNTPPFGTDHAEGVGLIDQQAGAMAILDRRDVGQRCTVAENAVKALDNHQGVLRPRSETPQALVQAGWIVVPEGVEVGGAKAAAIEQAGVGIGIEQHRVTGAEQRRQSAQIGRIPSGEHHRRRIAVKVRKLRFERHMGRVGAVGHARSRGAGAGLGQGVAARCNGLRVKGHPQVVVGARQNGGGTVDDAQCGGFQTLDHRTGGVGLTQPAPGFLHRRKLGQQAHATALPTTAANWAMLRTSASCR